jgi:hypothetical protein
MGDTTIEATRELCDDIDNILELAKRNRAPMRAVTLIELARADLQTRLDAFERLGSADLVDLG